MTAQKTVRVDRAKRPIGREALRSLAINRRAAVRRAERDQ
jgi:hypothetical protein